MTHDTLPPAAEAGDGDAMTQAAVARRQLFMAGAGAAALGLLGTDLARAQDAGGLSEVNILNFALNLEYLEAEFYSRALTGEGLDPGDITGRGRTRGVSGGRQVDFQQDIVRQYAREIANDEIKHVRFLRAALGNAAVARPRIDLGRAFDTAARAAGLIGEGESFDPYANDENFLLAAYIFEDVGVTAYRGAARFLQTPDIIDAAAGILAVEAYHAGEVRTLLAQRGLFRAARRISRLRDAADGPGKRDEGIGDDQNVNIIPTDPNGLAFGRTPDEVLNIVYLGGADAGFGFFPRRTNGAIR